MFRVVVFILLFIISTFGEASPTTLKHKAAGRCLKTGNHLAKPTFNPKPLHKMCAPWSSNSCCSPKTAHEAHNRVNHLAFDMNHCGANAISEECHREFVREMCYYSCDPYITPWISNPSSSFKKERLMQVPMCQRDCSRWWNACKESRTCVRNWRKHFDLTLEPHLNDTVNKCPKSAECKQFKEIYSDATNFCETVWDDSWKVVPDLDNCVRLDFPMNDANPNEHVEEFYLNRQMNKKDLDEKSSPLLAFLLWSVGFAVFIYIVGNLIYYLIMRVFCRMCC